MNLGINDLWPTKVLYSKFKDINLQQELASNILENLQFYLDNSKEHYKNSIFDLNLDIIQKFKNTEVLPIIDEYLEHIDIVIDKKEYYPKVVAWVTKPNDSYFLPPHNHKGAALSAVFYPFFEEKNKGGEIVLHDPRINANRGYINNFSKLFESKSFMPTSGDILVFPSFLYHHVNPYRSSARIAIAVDCFFVDFN